MKNNICYLLLVIMFLISGCSSNEENTISKKINEYEVTKVKGVDEEIKNYFGYTIQIIENDSYDVTYFINGKKDTISLSLGEYGLHKLRTSERNYLTIEDKGVDTYITLYLTKEIQEKWDVSY
jgi:hypothetical protein